MKLLSAIGISVFVLALTASGASAQISDATRQTCNQMGDPGSIAACTAIIDADQHADAATRSNDYVDRALQYQYLRESGEALVDYRTALQLDPDNDTAQHGIDDLTH